MPIRNDRRNYVVVGLFVLVMLSAGIVWLALLTGRTGATDDYHIHYDSVLGISEGTQVYLQGYPVGSVDDISPVRDAEGLRYRVTVRILRSFEVPADSTAQITAPSFLAALVIDIRAGEAAEAVPAGGEIRGVEYPDVFALVSDVADEFSRFTEESLQPLLDKVAERTPDILDNIDRATRELDQTVEGMNRLLGPENQAQIGRILANLETSTDEFASVMAGLRTTQANVDGALASVTLLLDESEGDVAHALTDLHHSLESVAAHIDAINHNLESTSRNLNEFSDQVRRDPSVLLLGRPRGEEVDR